VPKPSPSASAAAAAACACASDAATSDRTSGGTSWSDERPGKLSTASLRVGGEVRREGGGGGETK